MKVANYLCLSLILLVLTSSFTIAAEKESKGKVLVVVASTNVLTLKNGKTYPTGFFLNELGIPVKALVDAGYEPVFTDPLGNKPSMDEISEKPFFFANNEKDFKQIKTFVERQEGLKHPKTLAEVAKSDLNQYVGIFVPGGHAPMENLWKQAALGKLLRHFHEKKQPTALICHGPIALLSALKDPEALVSSMSEKTTKKPAWPYEGYNMTVFSTAEEKPNEPGELGGFMKFYPEAALIAAGGKLSEAAAKQSHVVIDRELITGQNPFSDNELAVAFVDALNAAAKKK